MKVSDFVNRAIDSVAVVAQSSIPWHAKGLEGSTNTRKVIIMSEVIESAAESRIGC